MTARRLVILGLVTLALLAGSYLAQNESARSSAAAKVSIGLEDAVPAARMKSTAELVEFWRGRVERDPRDYISLTYLAQTFMRRARETGDVAEYERAETVLRSALALNPNYALALAYQATVRYAMHDFAGALALAQRVYAADPGALQALATLGDAQLELGNYVEAESAYQKLGEAAPSAPVYSRLARLTWLQGHPAQALELMRKAADEAQESGLAGESAAWYQFQIGELYYSMGRLDDAAASYRQALATYDHYYLALAALGKVRAAQGQYDEAIRLYEQAVAIVPLPDLLAALGDLYTLAGQQDQAEQQYATVEFIGKLAAINQVVYNRQLALFYSNHDRNLPAAHELASRELEVRKDIYAYDTLAWSLYKAGRYREAADSMQQAMRLGTRDALLYYHAGMIQVELGDHAQASRMLTEALSINPHFDPLQASLARAALERLRAK